jgi:hypothetical protein
MKKLLLSLMLSFCFVSQAALYECRSNNPNEEEFNIQIHYKNNRYYAVFFDNDTNMVASCQRVSGMSGHNQRFLSCYGKDGNRETMMSFVFSGKSLIVLGEVLETWGGNQDYYGRFVCYNRN